MSYKYLKWNKKTFINKGFYDYPSDSDMPAFSYLLLVILSTHNMESVEELCDNIALIHQSHVVLQGKVFDIRMAHRPNIFRFRLLGNDFDFEDPAFTLLSKEPYHEFIDLRLQKADEVSNNDLMRMILDRYEVVSYDEELPTMHDVFIKTVTK